MEPKSSRKWHVEQEKLFLDLLIKHEYKPIGGLGDGVMERKEEARWGPLLERFLKDNQELASTWKTFSSLALKQDFDIKMLKRKWDGFKQVYNKLKKDCKVGRHQLAGETGAAADGQPTTAQAAVDVATTQWPLFATFHAAFGPVQRLRDDTFGDSVSPFKKSNAADAVTAGPVLEARAARPAAQRAVAALEVISAAENEDDGSPGTIDGGTESPRPSSLGGDDGKSDSDWPGPRKRARTSSRDVQLASAVTANRMSVAVKNAELRDQTAMKALDMSNTVKRDLMKQHLQCKEKMLERQLSCKETMQEHELEMQREKTRAHREKTQAVQVMEMTRLFVAAGDDPGEALRKAREACKPAD